MCVTLWCLVSQETPWFPLLGEENEYTFIGKVPVEERVRAAKPPMSKDECEVLLLVGLPGAGKSYWAKQRQDAEGERRYYVLGTNNIIDKMRVSQLCLLSGYYCPQMGKFLTKYALVILVTQVYVCNFSQISIAPCQSLRSN